MKVFSLGLVFSADHSRVLLLKKRSTDPYTADTWNGLGGHVEPDETPAIAISREVFEEAGLALHPTTWDELGTISDDKSFKVHVFAAVGDLGCARQKTDEVIESFDRAQAQALQLASGIGDILAPWLTGGQLISAVARPRATAA